MELCVLHIEIPQKTEEFNPEVKLTDPSVVDVWLLDAPTEMSRIIVGSMDHAPARRELLASITFSHATDSHSDEFQCDSGGFTTLELVCTTTESGCNVDFWQDQRAKPIGGEYPNHASRREII